MESRHFHEIMGQQGYCFIECYHSWRGVWSQEETGGLLALLMKGKLSPNIYLNSL
jgi:hypothetical protein